MGAGVYIYLNKEEVLLPPGLKLHVPEGWDYDIEIIYVGF